MAAGLGGLLAYGLTFFYGRRRLISLRPLMYAGISCWMFLALGGARYTYSLLVPPSSLAYHLATFQENPVTIRGTVERVLSSSFRKRSFFRVHRLTVDTLHIPLEGRVLVYLPASYTDTLYEGQALALHGRLAPLPRRRFPSDVDYGAYLFHKHIHARFYADTLLDTRKRAGTLLFKMRRYVRRILHDALPEPPVRALYAALFLGDRSKLDVHTYENFRTTGLSHLLAISGLHLLVLGFAVYRLLRVLLLRMGFSWKKAEILRTLLTFLILAGYVWISGGSESARRALVMATFFILAPLLHRSIHPLHALGMAGIILLLLDPHAAFRMGFQLSFAAVASLILLMPLFPHRLPRIPTFSYRTFTATLAVTAGTLPVLLYHTGRVYLAGLILNLLSIPLMSGVLLALLPVLFFFPFWEMGAYIYGQMASVCASTLLMLVEQGARWLGWLYLEISFSAFIPWVPFLIGLVAFFGQKQHPLRTRFLLLGIGISLVWNSLHFLRQPPLRVFFLDVGQGDATLIQFPDNSAILVDTGPLWNEEDPSCGRLLPFLRWAGVHRLSAVVLSHPHADHIGALPCLMQQIPVGRIITNGQRTEAPLVQRIYRMSDSLHIPVITALRGDTLSPDPRVRLYVLHPERTPSPLEDPNDGSLVCLLAYGTTHWLFTGDIGKEAEQAILRRFATLLPVDVVKIPHHGSSTSSSPAWVRRSTRAHTLGLIGVGQHNRYGLPDQEIVQRWEARGVQVFQTAREGTIWLETQGRRVERISWRLSADKHRYVRIPDKGIHRGAHS